MRANLKRFVCLLIVFTAAGAAAEDAQTFTTPGFSLTFPEGWHAKKITEGRISAATMPMSAVQATARIYYTAIPPQASAQEKARFLALQKHYSVKEYVNDAELKASHWHSKPSTATLDKNIKVERLDIEVQQPPQPGDAPQLVCNFIREYHAPLAEVHLTYSERGSCASAKEDFFKFSSLLVWK